MHLSVLGMYMNVNEQNMLSSGQYYNPMIPVYLMSPSDDIRKYAVYERYNASRNFPVQYWPWGSQSLQMQNPYWITNRNMFNTGKDRFLFGASLKYDVTDWLDITGRARIDYTHITAEQKNYASTLGLFAATRAAITTTPTSPRSVTPTCWPTSTKPSPTERSRSTPPSAPRSRTTSTARYCSAAT